MEVYVSYNRYIQNNINQQLASKDYPLCYFKNGQAAELNFVLQKENNIIGIEVVKGEKVKSRSLNIFSITNNPSYSICLSLENFT